MPKEEFTTKFKVDISDLKQGLKDATQQIKLADAQFKAATAGMDDWTKSTDGLKAKLSQLDSTLSAQKQKLSIYTEQLKRQQDAYDENGKRIEQLKQKLAELAEKGVSKTSEEYKKYENALASCEKEQASNEKACDKLKIQILEQEAAVGKTEKEIRNYNGELDNLEKESGEGEKAADDLGDALKDTGKAADDATDGFTVMKGALANLVAEGIKAAIQGLKDLAKSAYEAWESYDEGADSIIAATGATGEAAEELLAVYDEVSRNVVADFADIGTAVGEVNTRFGLTGDALEETSEQFLKFAELNGVDLKTAIDSTQSAMTAFGVSAEDTGAFLDVLNKAGQDTGVSVDKLTQLMVANAPALQEMGFSASDAALFIANLDKSGIDASSTMGGLKKALATAAKEGKPMSEALSELEDSIKNAESSTEAIRIATELFGAKAGPAIATAVSEGRLSFEELGTTMTDFQGNVDTTYENIKDGTDNIKLALQNLKLEAAKVFDTFLQEHGPQIEELVNNFTENVLPVLVDVMSGILDGISWLIDNLPTLIPFITAAAAAIGTYVAYTTAINLMEKGWKSLEIAQKAVAAAQQIMNAVMAANPIGLVIAAIAALIAIFVTLWNTSEDFRNFFINMWENIKKFVVDAWNAIKNGAVNAWNAIKGAWQSVKDWFKSKVIDPISNFFKDTWQKLKDGAKNAWEGIKSVFTAIPNWFKDKFHDAWQKVKDVFSTGGKIFDGIKEGITNAFKTVVNAIIRGINKVVAIPFNAINSMLDTLRDITILGLSPFSWLGSLSVPQIPELARGGVLRRGQMGLLEGSGAEAVVPLDRNKAWVQAVAKDMIREMNGGIINNSMVNNNQKGINYTQIINAPKAPSRIELYRQTRNLLSYAAGGV